MALLGLMVVSLVVTELILRARTPHILGPPGQYAGMFELDARGALAPVPGWTGTQTVDGRTIPLRLNNLGLRGADMGAKQGPRVLLLGDSMVFGAGVMADETVAAALEPRLSSAVGRPVEVGNGGVPGFGTRDVAAALPRHMLGFEPDVVVAFVYLGNDFVDDAWVYRTMIGDYLLVGSSARMAEASLRARLVVRFRLAYLFEQLVRRWLPGQAVSLHAQDWATPEDLAVLERFPRPNQRLYGLFMDVIEDSPLTEQVMDRVADSLRALQRAAGDAAVLVVILPGWAHVIPGEWEQTLAAQGQPLPDFRLGEAQRRVRSVCERLGLPWFDPTDRMRADRDPKRLFLPTDRHFSPEGHDQLAEWLAPWIAEQL